jgi:hypothetical protein
MINVQHWFYPQMMILAWIAYLMWGETSHYLSHRVQIQAQADKEQDPEVTAWLNDWAGESFKTKMGYVAIFLFILIKYGVLLGLMILGGLFA